MLGIAASRSMTAMSGRRSRGGAYSEIYSADGQPGRKCEDQRDQRDHHRVRQQRGYAELLFRIEQR